MSNAELIEQLKRAEGLLLGFGRITEAQGVEKAIAAHDKERAFARQLEESLAYQEEENMTLEQRIEELTEERDKYYKHYKSREHLMRRIERQEQELAELRELLRFFDGDKVNSHE